MQQKTTNPPPPRTQKGAKTLSNPQQCPILPRGRGGGGVSIDRCIKLNYFTFVCKEIALNELNLLCFAHYFSRLSPCYYYTLFFNDKWQTCLRDSKTLKVVLCTKFCPTCDKQVIASALVQLRINFTCIFKVF